MKNLNSKIVFLRLLVSLLISGILAAALYMHYQTFSSSIGASIFGSIMAIAFMDYALLKNPSAMSIIASFVFSIILLFYAPSFLKGIITGGDDKDMWLSFIMIIAINVFHGFLNAIIRKETVPRPPTDL
ncbi:MAG TPA: hypothetical protein PKH10_08720 [bacterium]|nr:hypothetical protein [bacterium]